MGQVSGADTVVLIADQDAYGAMNGTPEAMILPRTSFGLQPNQNEIDSEVIRSGRGSSESMLGNKSPAGPIATEIGAQSIGKMLKHLLGTVVTTGSGPYEHTITPGALPPGFTAELDHGTELSGVGRFMRYIGCKIASAELTFPQEGPATISMTVSAKEDSPSDTTMDASPDDHGHVSFSMFEASIKENNVTIGEVQQVTTNVENNLDESNYTIGSGGTKRDAKEGRVKVGGQVQAAFESLDLYNKARNRTETSIEIVLQKGTGDGSAGNEYFKLTLPQIKFVPTSPAIDGPGGVAVTFDYSAYEKAGDLGIEVVIRNEVAAL